MDRWLRLDGQAQVFIVERRERRLKTVVLNHAGNRRRVEYRSKAGIQNREAAADAEGRVVGLGGAQSGVIECAHPALVQRELRAQLIEANAGKRLSPAKCGQRLA